MLRAISSGGRARPGSAPRWGERSLKSSTAVCVTNGSSCLGAVGSFGLRTNGVFCLGSKAQPAKASIRMVAAMATRVLVRSEEHTSELQSRLHLVCRLLLEKKKQSRLTLNHIPASDPDPDNFLTSEYARCS